MVLVSRIFDHFNSKHVKNLMRLIIYLSENSRRVLTEHYVYKDPDWIKATKSIMIHGWNTTLTNGYVKKLRKYLHLSLNCRSNNAFDILTCLNNELYIRHRNGYYPNIFLSTRYTRPPRIPQINRYSWSLGFNITYAKEIKAYLSKNMIKKKKITRKEFETIFYKKYSKYTWKGKFR